LSAEAIWQDILGWWGWPVLGWTGALVGAASHWRQPIGLLLADVALCATSWSHGLCPWTG